ncbi:hypothetical protein BDW02DRAFT_426961 [Decorospora gaudefroyi]|uniref:BED-type domain-containing protein n=1 Tax=Decorospora gaudefroyi TaxID=184978 RepID=A0A6A5KGI5_9PLEO|nr:hypothetical protein BDW02DRAFT_426961 [Decorospora gaudefroyi]
MSRSQRSQLPLIAPVPSIFHSASSKRLSKARATTPISVASSSSASSGVEESSHELPIGDYSVVGEAFEVDFERVSRTEGRLVAARLGYRVRHKSQLKGNRALAPIWRYGVELTYLEDDGKRSKLWLCKLCHQSHRNNDAKIVNGTAHIARHLQNVHRVDPVLGLLPETPSQSRFSSPFEAAKVAGSSTPIAHSPWQEEALQSALVDWAILESEPSAACAAEFDDDFSKVRALSARGEEGRGKGVVAGG